MAGLFALGIEARRAGRAAGVECGGRLREGQKIPAKNGVDLLTTVSCLCIFNSEQMYIFVPCGFCLSARKELKMNKKEPVVLNSEVEMSKMLQTSEGALKASYHIAMQKISEYVKRNN